MRMMFMRLEREGPGEGLILELENSSFLRRERCCCMTRFVS